MKRLILFAVSLSVVALPAMAQAPLAPGATPKRCLKEREVLTEQVIRHGIFLREASSRCESLESGSMRLWGDFNVAFGARLKQQTDNHNKWMQKQFGDDWKLAADYYDGRQVTYYRNVPINSAYCENIRKLLEANKSKGWGSFAKQAKALHDDVTLDFQLCEPPR